MAAITLDRVLTEAESLPADEQVMLEDLLRQRRLEAWRGDTAAEAKKAAKDFRAGKLKSQPADDVIARLRVDDVRELNQAIERQGNKPLAPWAKAKKNLGLA